jgi:hypothetical protein
MKRYYLLTALLLAVPQTVHATSVQLNLTTSDPFQVSGTWTVTATLSDNQTLGIAAFLLDVDGTPGGVFSGVTVQKASGSNSNTPPTLIASNPPYSLFRSNGTLSSPNLTGIGVLQDTITAANNDDPSILRFGDGLTSSAASTVYGAIPPGGALTLATGRWTANGFGGSITAVVTPGGLFNLFPLNYAVDDGTGQFNPPPAGTVLSTVAASAVFSSTVFIPPLFPEPSSVVLMAISSLAFVAVAKHRLSRKCS